MTVPRDTERQLSTRILCIGDAVSSRCSSEALNVIQNSATTAKA